MTPDEIKDKLLLYRHIDWNYRISDYTDASLKLIQKSLTKARTELFMEIGSKDFRLPAGREEAVYNYLSDMSGAIGVELKGQILSASTEAGVKSVAEYNDILSFQGQAVGFNAVAVSPAQMTAIVSQAEFGGAVLNDWIKSTSGLIFDDDMKSDLVAGIFRGEGTAKLATRLSEGYDIFQRDALNIAQTFIAGTNNTSAKMVYDNNKDIIKNEEWNATLDNRICIRCMSMDGRKYKLDEPHTRPPLHINCVTAESIIFAPDATHFIKSNYSGPIVELTLSDGRRVSTTPNHMLSTPHGLVMARFLANGDNLLSCPEFEGALFGDPNDNRNNARIDNVIESLSEDFGMMPMSVPTSPEDLHGDGVFGDKDIKVIDAKSFLRDGLNSKFIEYFNGNGFSGVGISDLLPSHGIIAGFFKRYLSAPCSNIGVSREFLAFVKGCVVHPETHGLATSPCGNTICFEKFSNWASTCSECFGNLINRHFFIKEFENHFTVNVKGTVMNGLSDFEAVLDKHSFNSVPLGNPGNSCSSGKVPVDHVNFVKVAKVVNVNVVHKDNLPVYDVSTLSSCYIVNGVLSSNCRCFMLPVTKTFKELGLNINEISGQYRPWTERSPKDRTIMAVGQHSGDFESFLKTKNKTFQVDMLGPGRYGLWKSGKVGWKDLVDKKGDLRLLRKNKDGVVVGLMK